MNFELKVQAPKNAPVIWNYDELKENLSTALADYSNRVYTEDMLSEAKEDRAKLNKLKKAINDERIAREKEYMQPFNTFKEQAKEICEMIDEAAAGIGEQLDTFEQKRVDEKTALIEGYFADVISNYDLPFLTLEKIFNDKWYNKSTSDKAIIAEITAICEKAIKDLAVIRKMPKYAFEAEEAYKSSLDLNAALEAGEKISEIADRKRQAALEAAQEQVKNDSADRFEISFKCKLTLAQAKMLSAFCQENGIVLERI